MNLWRFVIAMGMKWRDSTKATSRFLKRVTLQDLQQQDPWASLTTIVQVQPDDDIFPIRAKYADEAQATIGLNHLTSKTPLWFTLADCIAAKLLTGKCVKVLRALTFEPTNPQDDLKPIKIAGNPDYRVDPHSDDFYRSLIDMRSEVKRKLKTDEPSDASRLDSEQQSLKNLANATSYGIFVELIVEGLDEQEKRLCYGPSGKPFAISIAKGEEPGRYFHPLLATLITGAARLMLALSETLAVQKGLDWAFCDTDSMALTKPAAMDCAEFLKTAKSVCDWFTPLNPYEIKGPLFKIEDANYALDNGERTSRIKPLHCYAVSAKRYVLFNLDANGRPVIRKATAHGLGHLRPPYGPDDAPPTIPTPSVSLSEIGVDRWEYDFWYQIIRAALDGHPEQVDLDYHPALDQPAASRYGATTPDLLRWFKSYNLNRAYRDQVKPFNFLLAYQASPLALSGQESAPKMPGRGNYRRTQPALKPIAPYDSNSSKAAKNCFDRETGELIPSRKLKSYREALTQYHLHPESKFLNGEPFDQGPTRRRHVQVTVVHHIGKEANRWEQQFYLGVDEGEQIEYGVSPKNLNKALETLRTKIRAAGQRKIARESGLSRRTLSRLLKGKTVRSVLVGRLVRMVDPTKDSEL